MRFVCLAFACALCASASADIGSSFDTDAEGWGTFNDATGFTWDGGIGNPSGAIRARDVGDGRIWYFAGSALFTGNLAGYYGGSILWDNVGISGSHTSVTGRADVMLVGSGGAIGIDIEGHPINGQWQSWSASIVEGDWYTVNSLSNGTLTGTPATADLMQAVLGDVTGMYIQGEYTSGGDAIGIDNVWLIVPGPGALSLMAGAGLLASRRRR